MSSMSAQTYGLSGEATRVIVDALSEAYGSNPVTVEELTDKNIRFQVRSAEANPSVVLVVLNKEGADKGRSAEKGLYSGSKYVEYTNITNLVGALNKILGTSLDVESYAPAGIFTEDTVEAQGTDSVATAGRVRFLELRVETLEGQLEEKTEELEALYASEPAEGAADGEGTANAFEVQQAKLGLAQLKEKYDLLFPEYTAQTEKFKSLETDHSKLLIKSSRSDAVLANESKLLRERTEALAKLQAEFDELKEKVRLHESQSEALLTAQSKVNRLRMELEEAGRELARSRSDLETLRKSTTPSEEVEALRESLRVAGVDLEGANSDLSSLRETVDQYKPEAEKVPGLEEDLRKMRIDLEEANKSVTTLNRDLLKARESLEGFQSHEGVEDVESYEKVNELEREIATLQSGVFYKLGTMTGPESNVTARLVPPVEKKNIDFVFPGNDMTTREVLRFVSNSIKRGYAGTEKVFSGFNPQRETIVVEVMAECYSDYVFGVSKPKGMYEWLYKGGNIESYLNGSKDRNVSVLTMGASFVNDGYFLEVDWNSRLEELSRSGYNVIVVCGSLSSLVPLVLYESFVGVGKTHIYVTGMPTGIRNLITRLQGTTASQTQGKTLDITITRMHRQSERFVAYLSQSHNCFVEAEEAEVIRKAVR